MPIKKKDRDKVRTSVCVLEREREIWLVRVGGRV